MNFPIPTSMGVLGLNPTSSIKSSTSANVAGTSPGCIGKKFLIAFLLNFYSIISIYLSNSTGWLLPMLNNR